MAFATLEEAWGLPPAARAPQPPPPGPRPRKRVSDARVGGWGPPPSTGGAWAATTTDADVFAAREVIQRAYAAHGLRGLATLLPPELARRVGGRPDSAWAAVTEFVSSPEKVLLVLLLAFLVLVFMESRSAATTVGARVPFPPSLGSMPATSLGA